MRTIFLTLFFPLCLLAQVPDPVFLGAANAAGGDSSYTANAVTYNGSTSYLQRTNPVGVVNGKAGTLSLWFKFAGAGSTRMHLFDSESVTLLRYTNSKLQLNLRNTGGSIFVQLAGVPDVTDTAWHHYYASWDTTDTGKRKLYIDGTNALDTVSLWSNEAIWYEYDNWRLGCDVSGGNMYAGCLADVWFGTNYLDSVSSFRDGDKPKNLGDGTVGGTSPAVWLKSDYLTPGVNSGFGGNYTTNGAFSSCTAP